MGWEEDKRNWNCKAIQHAGICLGQLGGYKEASESVCVTGSRESLLSQKINEAWLSTVCADVPSFKARCAFRTGNSTGVVPPRKKL